MKKVLIIGGTRFFGRGILAAFVSRGDQVIVLSRGNRPLPANHSSLQWIKCDRKDEGELRATLGGRDFDVVIDNVCYEPEDAQAAVRVFAGRCGRYILTSSVMSYYNLTLSAQSLTEDEWPKGTSLDGMEAQYLPQELNYARNKRGCEEVFLSTDDLDTTVMRLQNVVGEDDFSGKSGSLPLALIQGDSVAINAQENDTYQQLYSHDIGPAYARAADTGLSGSSHAYNLAAAPIAVPGYLDVLADALDVPLSISCADDQKPRGVPFPTNVTIDCTKAEQELGIAFTPCEAFLPPVARWYAAQGKNP